MRRPSPLPTTPTPSESDRSRARRPAPAPDPAPAVTDDPPPDGETPLLDVAEPMTAPIPLPERDRADAPGEATSAATDATGERVGIRDVWRATRARRRTLRAEVRRFTVRARRRRAVWIGVGAALVLLVLGTLGAAYSPLFAVERIRVIGAEAVDASSVEDALSGQVGTPLPLVDASAIKAELVAFPLIESYVLEARPPHELVVRIVERTPIGVVDSAAGFTVVDAAGVALSTSPTRPDGFALLDAAGGVGSDAFLAVGQVLRSLPEDLRATVSEASATSPDDVSFVLGDTGATVVWGSADDSALKAVLLERLMSSRPPGAGVAYDVSSTGAVVVR